MKTLRAVLLLPVLVALLSGTALAKAPALGAARVDQSFFRHGSLTVNAPLDPANYTPRTHLAVAPDNESYVLHAPWIYAFGANGQPDPTFGENARVLVAPKAGALVEVTGITVDSQDRILVTGTLEPIPGPSRTGPGPTLFDSARVFEAFVIRYRPDGSLDGSFGNGGEVVTSFGAPHPVKSPDYPMEYERPVVKATQIVVDAADRPVIAAKYVQRFIPCYNKDAYDQAFVARLNSDGTLDTSFGSGGIATISGEIAIGLAATPGGWATLSGEEVCEHGVTGLPSQLSVLTEAGAPEPGLDPVRPSLKAEEEVLAVDALGRLYFTERADEFIVPRPRVVRLLANGDLDASYGHGGAVALKPLTTKVSALAVDGRGRIVVGRAGGQLEIERISSSGKLETGFGKGGLLRASTPVMVTTEAVAIDSKGRIVVAGPATGDSLKSGHGIAIARFLPGS